MFGLSKGKHILSEAELAADSLVPYKKIIMPIPAPVEIVVEHMVSYPIVSILRKSKKMLLLLLRGP